MRSREQEGPGPPDLSAKTAFWPQGATWAVKKMGDAPSVCLTAETQESILNMYGLPL